uniref:Ig-like domain-containing protein n=1 Tax=Sphaeramia orbicularis TaxID=375764 RepID=A0A672Y9B8_9TELE
MKIWISWSLFFLVSFHGKVTCKHFCFFVCFTLNSSFNGLCCFSYFTGAWSEIKLEQPSSEVKRPGDTVKISCITSGYTMTSYSISWIRQKPGQSLTFIGWINTDTSTPTYASTFQSRFTISQDVPSSTQYLEIRSLTTDDSAVYYCARVHSD